MAKVIELQKTLDDHTKDELNEILAKFKKDPKKRHDHAANEVRKLIAEGKITSIFDETSLLNENLEEEQAEAKKAKRKEKREKEKAEKPIIDYDWKASPYEGRQVYALGHTVRILQESADKEYFLVQLPNGEERPAKQSTTRFEAVKDGYRERYVKDTSVRTASGSPSIHCGDDLAESLKGLGLNDLGKVAKENGIKDRFDGWADAGRNPGMIRMNLANVLRAKVRKGETVSILGEGNLKSAAQVGKKRAQELAAQAEAEKKAKAEAKTKADAERQAAKEAKAAEKAKAKEEKAKSKPTKTEKKAPKAKAEVA